MRYLRAREEEDAECFAYRMYVTDSLHYQGEGKMLTSRWADVVQRKVDTRTGDEIVMDVINGAGLVLQGSD